MSVWTWLLSGITFSLPGSFKLKTLYANPCIKKGVSPTVSCIVVMYAKTSLWKQKSQWVTELPIGHASSWSWTSPLGTQPNHFLWSGMLWSGSAPHVYSAGGTAIIILENQRCTPASLWHHFSTPKIKWAGSTTTTTQTGGRADFVFWRTSLTIR